MGALVMAQDSGSAIDYNRAAAAEISDRVRLNYVEADGDFEIAASEAVFPENETRDISTSELNIALKREEARAIVERWLIEARVGRDRASFSLPPSLGHLGAGDVVKLAEPGGLASYGIDQFEQGDQGLVQAVRVDETLYQGSSIAQKPLELAATTPITSVFPLFMDLPLITGDELPHAPYVAATAEPWPGPVALYSSCYDADFALNTVLQSPAVLGVTATPLAAATPGILDHGAPLEVELTRGSLSGVTLEALLAGANLAAIGDGSPDNWEIFQFQSADLMASGRYELSGRLRGQLGSDALMPAHWPAGSHFFCLMAHRSRSNLPLRDAISCNISRSAQRRDPIPIIVIASSVQPSRATGCVPMRRCIWIKDGMVQMLNFLGSGARAWMGPLGIWLKFHCWKRLSAIR